MEEAYTSEHWIVRIYKVKDYPNRGVWAVTRWLTCLATKRHQKPPKSLNTTKTRKKTSFRFNNNIRDHLHKSGCEVNFKVWMLFATVALNYLNFVWQKNGFIYFFHRNSFQSYKVVFDPPWAAHYSSSLVSYMRV